jgi:hypothetical protein
MSHVVNSRRSPERSDGDRRTTGASEAGGRVRRANFGKARSALPALFVLAAGTTAALVACANSDEERKVEQTPSETDSGAGTTLPEAAVADATADADPVADAGADVDREPRTCSDDGFCYSTVPAGELLRGVWGDGLGVVWAVSTTGDVLRWDGAAWNVQATGLGALSWISGTGPTDLWVVNTAGGVFHGTGASPTALTFAPVTLPGDATLLIKAVWGTSPTDVWAVGGKQGGYPYVAAGKALHFDGSIDDSGAPVWTIDEDLSTRPVMYTAAWGTPGGGVWVSGSSNYTSTTGMYRGTNPTNVIVRRAPGSSTWAEETIPFPSTGEPPAVALAPAGLTPDVQALPRAAQANADGSVWLIGYTAFGSKRFRWLGTTADNGQTYTWTPYAQFSWDLPAASTTGVSGATGVWGMAANDSWEIGPYGRMAHWDGTAWNQAALMVTSAPLAKTFYAVWGTSSNDFWAVGDELAVHKTTANKP